MGYYGDRKNVRSEGVVIASLTLHRRMEHGSESVIAVTFAGSPMLELDTNSSLAKLLHT